MHPSVVVELFSPDVFSRWRGEDWVCMVMKILGKFFKKSRFPDQEELWKIKNIKHFWKVCGIFENYVFFPPINLRSVTLFLLSSILIIP